MGNGYRQENPNVPSPNVPSSGNITDIKESKLEPSVRPFHSSPLPLHSFYKYVECISGDFALNHRDDEVSVQQEGKAHIPTLTVAQGKIRVQTTTVTPTSLKVGIIADSKVTTSSNTSKTATHQHGNTTTSSNSSRTSSNLTTTSNNAATARSDSSYYSRLFVSERLSTVESTDSGCIGTKQIKGVDGQIKIPIANPNPNTNTKRCS